MNDVNILRIVLVVIVCLLVRFIIENFILREKYEKLKVALLILSYNLDLYNTLYGVIDKKDFEKANLIITQARRKEEASGRNPK